MAFSFLQLPREIRDQIYFCVVNPTGLVTISRSPSGRYIPSAYPGNDEIAFSLLQTCHRVKDEAEHVFRLLWHFNVPCVSFRGGARPDDDKPTPELEYLRDHFGDKIRNLEFHYELNSLFPIFTFGDAELIMNWDSEAPLKSVCFRLGGPDSLREFKSMGGKPVKRYSASCCGRRRSKDNHFLKTLRSMKKQLWFARESESLPSIDWKLEFELRVEILSLVDKLEWLQALSMDKCERLLKRASESLGGEVWVDGILCYRKGEEIRTIFREWEVVMERESARLDAEKRRTREILNTPGPWTGNYYEVLAEA